MQDRVLVNNFLLRPSQVYTIIIVRLSRAIKGAVSLLSLAYSSQGRHGVRIESETAQSDCECSAQLMFAVFSSNAKEQQQWNCSYKKGDLQVIKCEGYSSRLVLYPNQVFCSL